MSSASPFRRSAPEVSPERNAQWLRSLLVGPARFAGFWSAVTMPFALLWLVVSGSATQQAPLLVALLAANLLALVVGHGHNRE